MVFLYILSISFTIAPTGAPTNVTVQVESSTGIFISWRPPEKLKQNGIITNYNVEIHPTTVSTQLRKYRISSDSTSVMITGKLYIGSVTHIL